MKRFLPIFLVILISFALCACNQATQENSDTWQEQYDLGVRYLSEGNYAEAIIAFTTAIEIDPKQAPAYVGRGDVYILSGETEESLIAAQADYEQAIELDKTNADAYLGLADVYIRQGEYDKAYQILKDGLDKSGSQPIADKIAEIENGIYTDSSRHIRRNDDYNADGTLDGYTLYEYDFLGRRCYWENYNQQYDAEGEATGGIVMDNYCEVDFDNENRISQYRFYEPDGTLTKYDTIVYNEQDLKTEQHRFTADGTEQAYFLYYYNNQGQEIKYESYHVDGSMYAYWVSEYDADGNLIKKTRYDPDGTMMGYKIYE